MQRGGHRADDHVLQAGFTRLGVVPRHAASTNSGMVASSRLTYRVIRSRAEMRNIMPLTVNSSTV